MIEISTKLIKEAIYNLCFKANTCLDKNVYLKILNAYKSAKNEEKNILKMILQNAKIAYEKQIPLCQDTGQVVVFIKIGQNICLKGEYLETAINSAIEKCYVDNFFRKSVVKNALFNRENTKNNTPAIIYTQITDKEEIEISVLIKGAGSENKSKLEMMLPTATEEEIIKTCGDLIISAGENACPPMFIGVGFGAIADKAMVLSKEALISENFSDEEKLIAEKIKSYVNKNSDSVLKNSYVLDVKVKSSVTHIACLPMAITVNCHSDRVSSCTIISNKIFYHHQKPDFVEIKENEQQKKEIKTEDIKAIKSLKVGEEILLTGTVYIARDMAHKKLKYLMDNGEKLPFDIKDKIVFYAGPCPDKSEKIIGSIGPTTASRMDKFAVEFYNKGLLATIGKGNRSKEIKLVAKKNGGKYFSTIGGVAALLADKVKQKEIIAFEDLGPEAIYRIKVEKFPVKVEI